MHSLTTLDKSLLIWINGHHNVVLDAILIPVSLAGEFGAIWFAVCLGLLIFGKRRHRIAALMLLVTMIVVDRLVAAQIGHFVPRERPYLAIQGIRQAGVRWTGNSFPSGHAHTVWEAAIILGSRWRRLIVPLVVFALLTCYSRPYLGMHYPGDVLAGSALGIIGGFGAVMIGRLADRKKKRVEDDEG
jgi:undecaprenyl-diphosphatase